MSNFEKIEGASSLYRYMGSGEGFIAFHLMEYRGEGSPPGSMSPDTTWKYCMGYYLFLRSAPSSLTTFATDIATHIAGASKYATDRPGILWLTYTSEVDVVACIINEKQENGEGEEDDDVRVIGEHIINFGGYRLPIANGMEITFEDTMDGARLVISHPDDPEPACPDISIGRSPVPDYKMFLWLTGTKARSFEGTLVINDYFSTNANTSWNVALRYLVNTDTATVHQFYPIFDFSDGRRPLLALRWDPLDQLDPARTYLQFKGEAIQYKKVGDGECDYELVTPSDQEVMPTYFRTVTGEIIAFRPVLAGTLPSRLIFEVKGEYTDHAALEAKDIEVGWLGKIDKPDNARYYLVPWGEFEMELVEMPMDENCVISVVRIDSCMEKAEMPARFLCGLSGVESVGFQPRDADIAGDKITFFPRKSAYVPRYPIIRAATEATPASADLRLIKRNYLTAWAAISGTGMHGMIPYFSQPENSPLYNNNDNNMEDQILSLFEPLAAPLPAPGFKYCFPLAPPAGAIPGTGAPADGDYIRKVESEIISPWRRDVIRRFFEGNGAPAWSNAPEALRGGAATPQGLIASIAELESKWASLVLARSTKPTSSTTLEFLNLDRTLQAAVQSNQLFLVATQGAHFNAQTGFRTNVQMNGWTFNLDPGLNTFATQQAEAGVFTDLNNTIIFKFSPGKLRERIRDPRSWTNPEGFNAAAGDKIPPLAAKLKAFFDAVETNTDKNYADLKRIMNDPNWTGILGINIQIRMEDLPQELKLLAAGVDKTKFVAHHVAVETSTLEFNAGESLGPPECSIIALVDYTGSGAGANTNANQDADFQVKRLVAFFRNGALLDFRAEAELSIFKLFDEVVTPAGTGRVVNLIGAHEKHEGADTYTFRIGNLGPATLDSSVIDNVTLEKADLGLTEVPVTGDTELRATFSFWGTMKFKPLGDAGAFDVLSYESVPYSGLTIRLTFQSKTPTGRTLTVDISAFSLDGTQPGANVRNASLVKRFPMKLQKLSVWSSHTALGQSGYVLVTSALGTLQNTTKTYGLEFSLNLGSLGDFAAAAGLTVNLAIVWNPKPADKRAVYLKFPGVSGGGNDLFTIEGVIRFGASGYELKKYGGDTPGWLLIIDSLALRVLGLSFPMEDKPSIYIFGPPPDTQNPPANPDDALGWYGVKR